MTLEALFLKFVEYRALLVPTLFLAPWLAYVLCLVIPGKREEPFILSLNLGLAVLSLFLWAGYLVYASNTGGWQQVIRQADVMLLLAPIYYFVTSLWLSRYRLPLEQIPAFRTTQGLAIMAGVFLVFAWLMSRVHIWFFTFIPFPIFLLLLITLLGIGYTGYRRVVS
ncbi:MAG: hypothetical protein WCA07_10820 [Gloeobacterales cyanobacterium]